MSKSPTAKKKYAQRLQSQAYHKARKRAAIDAARKAEAAAKARHWDDRIGAYQPGPAPTA